MSPRAVLGVPLYGGGPHLAEALDGLAQQTAGDYAVVFADDAADDAARALVERHAAAGAPFAYERNSHRLGLTGNWRRAFELALERHPDAAYFAWGSDHDAWHRRWLEALVAALDAAPEAVLAYPRTATVDAEGGSPRVLRAFETRGVADPAERLRAAIPGMAAGTMVYGLYRVDALRRAAVFRDALLPDRLLLTELSLLGEFHQVDEVLFSRRRVTAPSRRRQREASFPDGAPASARAPWWAAHAAILGRELLAGRAGPPGAPRRERAALAALQARATVAYVARRRVRRARKRVRRALGRVAPRRLVNVAVDVATRARRRRRAPDG